MSKPKIVWYALSRLNNEYFVFRVLDENYRVVEYDICHLYGLMDKAFEFRARGFEVMEGDPTIPLPELTEEQARKLLDSPKPPKFKVPKGTPKWWEKVLAELPEPEYVEKISPEDCVPHRGPQGPCEDIGQCPRCESISFRMRPPGECFGHHAPDCSLEERHEGICVGGGSGHPTGKLRGYPEFTWDSILPSDNEVS